MNPLRSVATRLSLALLLVVAGSLTLVYLVVIPSLQSHLIDSKVHQLQKSVPSLLAIYRDDTLTNYFAQDAEEVVNARVVFTILSGSPLTLSVQQDTHGLTSSSDVTNDPTALKTAASGNLEHARA